ncbi:HlyD family secretion protein [Alloalcanivorax sp. C16-2]|uniref:HlyD family secretion protein n=1 Tax=Alloalcanivorax TaxID=3020832 RepID=UPI00193213AD|nr:HlyD family efflux transporter periplasmic adaptor subunit [Alloalcanivorax marinus]MBL7249400.1 HlyD family efflux transporter periplasmic adaptor subunit [Alloalcanivorax marinus]
MKARAVLIALVAVVAVALLATAFWNAYRPRTPLLQGQVEARQYLVSSKVPGRLAETLVRKGDRVAKGDPVFTIDSPELEQKLAQVDALDRISSALISAVEGGTREEKIQAARSEFEKAKVAEQLAETTYRRVRALADEGVVARQKLDEAYTAWQVAVKTRVTAGQVLKLAEAGPRSEARDASTATGDVTASLRQEVQELLDDARVTAPHAGEVDDVALQPGELVPQGFPVVTLTDLDDAWAVFNVREDHLARFQPGEVFTLSIPALDREAEFQVSHLAARGDYATWRATGAGQDYDLRTFEVELRPRTPVDGLRPGMSVLLEAEP